MKIAYILPLLASTVAAPAYAQDFGTGARVELRAGYDEARFHVELGGGIDEEHKSEKDIVFGVEAGFDLRAFENIVLGVYGGLEWSNIDNCGEVFQDFGDQLCVKVGRNMTLGGRVGMATGDGGLIYVKGGYSRGRFKASYDDGAGLFVEESDTVGGWHVGAGFELGITHNIYAKAEYIHTRYHTMFEDQLTEDERLEPTRHQLMGGIGFRFGVSAPPAPVEPAMAPPPPPQAPAATQTCPDGSVIMATDACPLPPAPPPPPPPPEPSGQRG